MKTVITTLNAKYIHTSLALRWLYVSNKDRCDIQFKEYAIKENPEIIAADLLSTGCDIVGLSVYIWNVSLMGRLISLLKQQKPELIIIVGGPEVTYEPEHFLKVWDIDYVISGEGEIVLGELIQSVERGEDPRIPGISSRKHVSNSVAKVDLKLLSQMPSPYMLEEDKEHLKNRLMYFETSRGCPYQCQYCLSSRETGVRYFPMEYIFENLKYLINAGAKQIKFLDRTFNLNKTHTKAIFDFLIQHRKEGLSCQFEIYADLLTDEMIDYLNMALPENFFRFEIGIQSTYEPTNLAVKRKQDFPLLAGNIQKLMEGGKVVLHVDLIAGLPYETYDRFVRSFNDVFALGAKEVQLGFLKMLRGTNLRRDAEIYGYSFSDESPYEIHYNADISSDELHRIHNAEHALEKYWNSGRFSLTMRELFSNQYAGRYFEFFDELGQYCVEQQFPERGYQLEDLYACLHRFLLSKGIDLFVPLRTDYYENFTLRPPGFWMDRLDKHMKKKLLYQIGQDKAFLREHGLTRKTVEKLAAIDPIDDHTFLLTLFINEAPGKTQRIPIIYHFKPS